MDKLGEVKIGLVPVLIGIALIIIFGYFAFVGHNYSKYYKAVKATYPDIDEEITLSDLKKKLSSRTSPSGSLDGNDDTDPKADWEKIE